MKESKQIRGQRGQRGDNVNVIVSEKRGGSSVGTTIRLGRVWPFPADHSSKKS